MKNFVIEPGIRFCKTDAPATVWIVARLLDFADAGEHVQLYQKDHPRRTLTVATSALRDKKMFRLAEAA